MFVDVYVVAGATTATPSQESTSVSTQNQSAQEPAPLPTQEPAPLPTQEPVPLPTQEPVPLPTQESEPLPTHQPASLPEPLSAPAATSLPASAVTVTPPFDIGSRVISRKKSGDTLTSQFHLGVVISLSQKKQRRRNRRRAPEWQFLIRFDDQSEEIVDYILKRTQSCNVKHSDEPLPDPPAELAESSDEAELTDETDPPHSVGQRQPTPAEIQRVLEPPPPPRVTTTIDGQHETWYGLKLEQILFLDEKHVKCKLGLANGHEWLMCVDPNNPDHAMSLKNGGVRQEAQPITRAKYNKEARGLFGVYMTDDGVGRRIPVFNYTEKTVIGPARYKKLLYAEVDRVKRLKNTGKSGIYKLAGNDLDGGPLEAKFGREWKDVVRGRIKSAGIMCVTELMDHVIKWGNHAFKDTSYKDNW